MGLIQRQSIKNSIVNYVGIIIGGLSTLFIYPLNWELYGEIQFSLSSALLLSSLFSFGSYSLVNKFFPYFRENKIRGFLLLVLMICIINIVIVSILLYFLKAPIFQFLENFDFEVVRIANDLFMIYPIGILLALISILRYQSANFGRIVFPDIISNFSLKLIVPILVLIDYFILADFRITGWLLVLYHLLIIIFLMLYLRFLNGLDLSFSVMRHTSFKKIKEMWNYMVFGAMNHFGNILVYKIDIIMIGLLLTATKVGYYSIFLFLSVVLEVPTKAIFQISAPIISEDIDKGKIPQVEKIYRQSSNNLYILGILIFIGIWLNIDLFFALMTKGEDLLIYKSVFLFLALTRLFDMITSVNFHIIAYSRYFKFNTVFILILAILNIILNYYLIEVFDIVGAAISTAISMFVYNLLKTVFVYTKFKIHPFNLKHFPLTLLLIIVITLPFIFQNIFQQYLYSLLISLCILVITIISLYRSKASEDFNKFIDALRNKF